MCGITGYWQPVEGCGVRGAIDTMTEAIAHRGPDGRGPHVDAEAGLAMGHTRLSIAGLEDGTQPMLSADGRRAPTVNGELYDYRDPSRAGL